MKKQGLKIHKYEKTFGVAVCFCAVFLAIGFLIVSAQPTVEEANASTLIDASVTDTGYYLEATSSLDGRLDLNVEATSDGGMASGHDSIAVATNAPRGYQFYIGTNKINDNSLSLLDDP